MKSRAVVLFTIVFVCASLARTAHAETYPQTREGWLVGFGIGGGTAGVSGSSTREGGTAGSFRVGYAFQPELSIELNSTAWTKSESGTTLTFSVAGPAVAFCPLGSQGLGLVLKAGAGLGTVSASSSSGSSTFTASESGFGVLAGAAYEFRLRRTFAIGPQVDFNYLSINGESANYVDFGLGFNWYFIPKK